MRFQGLELRVFLGLVGSCCMGFRVPEERGESVTYCPQGRKYQSTYMVECRVSIPGSLEGQCRLVT